MPRVNVQSEDRLKPGLRAKPTAHSRKSQIPLLLLTLLILHPLSLTAFPPAPHHLLFGQVRDEWGNPVPAKSAEVFLETPAGLQIKSPIVSTLAPGVNYNLQIPMDSGITADNYKPNALRSSVPYKMWVRINGVNFLPIEMRATSSSLGQPAQATRLDLTLGEDSDGDGLPDAWERALQSQFGGELKDIRPGDDSDRDGISNLNEYLAGTYAFDGKDGFSLKMTEMKADSATMEFMSIRGRTYTVFGSSDLNDWAQVSFRLPEDGAEAQARQNYSAAESRPVRISVRPPQDSMSIRFFKLRVE